MTDRIVIPSLILPPGARLDEYTGLWAIEEQRGRSIFDLAQCMDWGSHARSFRAEAGEKAREPVIATNVEAYVDGRPTTIAVIEIRGMMMKQRSSLTQSTSTVQVRRELRAATADPTVGGILLVIDSPGGTVSGTADLGRDVRNAAATKPTWAFVEDLAASAAMWVASQASRIDANDSSAIVGSIGVFMGTYDLSKHAEQKGIEAVVFKTGALKGAGFPGSVLTQEQRDHYQQIVDETHEQFVTVVAEGRGLDVQRVRDLADGGVMHAPAGQGAGLIDDIRPLETVLADLAREAATGGASQRNARMETVMPKQSPHSTQAAGAGHQASNTVDTHTDATASGEPASPPASTGTADSPTASRQFVVAPCGETTVEPASESAAAFDDVAGSATPATLAQLKEAFPTSTADWRESCLEQGMSIDQARAAWAEQLESQLAKERARADELEKRAEGQADRGGDPVAFQSRGSEAGTTKLANSIGKTAAGIAGAIRIRGSGG